MNFYKDNENKFYAYSDEQLELDIIKDKIKDMTPSSKEEVEEASKPTQDQLVNSRILELKMKLSESDFKVLPDYDRDNTQIKIERQAWRNEIRSLEDE